MSASLQNSSLLLRVGLYFMAALAVALVAGCGSQAAPKPTPTVAPTSTPVVIPTVPPAPASGNGTESRAMAPNFSLSSAGGSQVSLSGLLEDHRAVVIVFYRGFF